ncbi:hypothetical protein BKA80DRAFT_264176 [Phyllosticta citrichinensis]
MFNALSRARPNSTSLLRARALSKPVNRPPTSITMASARTQSTLPAGTPRSLPLRAPILGS